MAETLYRVRYDGRPWIGGYFADSPTAALEKARRMNSSHDPARFTLAQHQPGPAEAAAIVRATR